MGVKLIVIIAALSLAIGLFSGILLHFPTDNRMKAESFIVPSEDVLSPYNRVPIGDVHLFESKACIDLEKPFMAEYFDTNSMDPLLDKGSKGINVRPKAEEDIHPGDVIAYKYSAFEAPIVHQVVFIGDDEEGWYALAKGINANSADSHKIRFNQITSILIAVVY